MYLHQCQGGNCLAIAVQYLLISKTIFFYQVMEAGITKILADQQPRVPIKSILFWNRDLAGLEVPANMPACNGLLQAIVIVNRRGNGYDPVTLLMGKAAESALGAVRAK
jgi:hypothetical protein